MPSKTENKDFHDNIDYMLNKISELTSENAKLVEENKILTGILLAGISSYAELSSTLNIVLKRIEKSLGIDEAMNLDDKIRGKK